MWIKLPSAFQISSNIQAMKRLALNFLLFFFFSGAICHALAPLEQTADFYVDYSARPHPQHLLLSQLSIIHPEAKIDLPLLHKANNRALAYISVCEVAPDATYRSKIKGISFLGKNKEWKSDFPDISQPSWQTFLLKQLAQPAVEKGFDGFFLDTVDSLNTISEKYPERATQFKTSLIELIQALKKQFPDKMIITNRGFEIYEEVKNQIDGVLAESLFQTYDSEKKVYRAVPEKDREWLTQKLKHIQETGKEVYVLDYVSPYEKELAKKTSTAIQALGFHPFLSTPDLSGTCSLPSQIKARKIFVLYGNDAKTLGKAGTHWPMDTITVRAFQMPLEYLGYQLEYYNAFENSTPLALDEKYAAILVDPDLRIPTIKESAWIEWLITQKEQGKKLLLLGRPSTWIVTNENKREAFAKMLGIHFSPKEVALGKPLRFLQKDTKIVGFESEPRLLSDYYSGMKAPKDAHVALSVEIQGEKNPKKIFQSDSVFTTPWGGVLLAPFIFFSRSDGVELWITNPFDFFAQALETPSWPVPDTTTLNGLRIFYTHIDADGFSSLSNTKKGLTTAEILQDFVFKKYSFPITVSVIESEIRGMLVHQKEEDATKLKQIARSIFSLPHIHAASHSFSHPYIWIPNDLTGSAYDQGNLSLKTPEKGMLNYEREIKGSIHFIESELLPLGKKVEIFLWSGNCRPAPEAIKQARDLGIPNMNGGETLISTLDPSITTVAPRGIPWENEFQIFSANQNDNLYMNRTDNTFMGGFINILDTFKRTESPRRLKPINVYYHFFSGTWDSSLNAIIKIYDWVLKQNIIAITAREYADIVTSATHVDVYSQTSEHWILLHDGNVRTFRLPFQNLFPDMTRSQGITGFHVEQGQLYIHSNGSPKIDLFLTSTPQPHLYVDSSSAQIHFEKLREKMTQFTTHNFRPIEVIFGGAAPFSQGTVEINGSSQNIQADGMGRLILQLPQEAKVFLRLK